MRRLSVIVLGLCVCACDTQRVTVAGKAMEPTLNDGEHILLTRTIAELKRTDVVEFRYPLDESKPFIKRIVGMPGEQIASVEGRISINGRSLDEPYVVEANRSHDSWGPKLLAAEEYFMMGDNRGNSADSRTFGPVRRSAILAKILGK